jgi:alanine racemase
MRRENSVTHREERQDGTVVRATRAVIDLHAIGQNVSAIRRRIGDGRHLMAVVKADGYGHGALQVSRTALSSGADCLAVAVPEEGQELRREGIECPILVFGLIQPSEAWKTVEAELEQTVCSADLLDALDQESRKRGVTTAVHIKVDTGMGRIGLAPGDVVEFSRRVKDYPNLSLKGLYSHLSCADEKDKAFTRIQIARFQEVLGVLAGAGISIPLRHLANSAGVLDFPEAYFDIVRPGIMIYGLYPSPDVSHSVVLHPAMSFVTRICQLKEVSAGTPIGYGATFVTTEEMTRIATIPVGYADGYRRLLSNKAEVLVKGTRVPLLGRVAMDMCMLDVTSVSDVRTGDDVVLFGKGLPVEEMASLIGTINYEVVTGIGKRVPRVYV